MAIGPMTAHLEGLLSRAGVMAAAVAKDPSGGVRRARLQEFVSGRCLYPSALPKRSRWAWRGPPWCFRLVWGQWAGMELSHGSFRASWTKLGQAGL